MQIKHKFGCFSPPESPLGTLALFSIARQSPQAGDSAGGNPLCIRGSKDIMRLPFLLKIFSLKKF